MTYPDQILVLCKIPHCPICNARRLDFYGITGGVAPRWMDVQKFLDDQFEITPDDVIKLGRGILSKIGSNENNLVNRYTVLDKFGQRRVRPELVARYTWDRDAGESITVPLQDRAGDITEKLAPSAGTPFGKADEEREFIEAAREVLDFTPLELPESIDE